MAAELNSGMRLVMERTIRPNWFAQVRSAGLRQPVEAGVGSLNGFRNTASEIATADELTRLATAINAYKSLVALRSSPSDEHSKNLLESLNKLATMSPSGETSRDRLSRLLGPGNGVKPPPANSDDAVFASAASQVFKSK
jgi:hypothetical protein